MLGNDYSQQVCSVARSLEVIGERWTLLVVRDLLLGITRFDDLAESVGVARTVLTRRLTHLLEQGVITRTAYQQNPVRYDYQLTLKGAELATVVAALMRWGDTYYPHPDGPPRLLTHHACGGTAELRLVCPACDRSLAVTEVETPRGPGHA